MFEYLTPAFELDKIARVFIILFLLQIVRTSPIRANIIIKEKSQYYLGPYFGKVCRWMTKLNSPPTHNVKSIPIS